MSYGGGADAPSFALNTDQNVLDDIEVEYLL